MNPLGHMVSEISSTETTKGEEEEASEGEEVVESDARFLGSINRWEAQRADATASFEEDSRNMSASTVLLDTVLLFSK
jgi:hypothetical protein